MPKMLENPKIFKNLPNLCRFFCEIRKFSDFFLKISMKKTSFLDSVGHYMECHYNL